MERWRHRVKGICRIGDLGQWCELIKKRQRRISLGEAVRSEMRTLLASSLHYFLTSSLLLLVGCAARMPEGSRPAGLASTRLDLPQRIAILPLENGTDKKEAVDVVRAALHQQLSATTYVVQKPYITDELLGKAGLQDAQAAAKADVAELARVLNVDAIVTGKVTDYTRIYAVVYAQVAVGASVQLITVPRGTVLWEKSHVQRSHGGSAALSPWGLIAAAGMTALHLREAELLHVADDLARELVAGLPTPVTSRTVRPPVVTAIASDAAGETRRAGQRIQVTAVGPPGLRGAFDLVGLKSGIPLEEGAEGVYRGEYTVAPGDNAPHAVVVGALVDTQGLRGERQDGRGTIRIDTTPPPAPQGVVAMPGDGTVQLAWSAVGETDLAAYRVHRSERPLTGFEAVGTTEATTLRDGGLANLKPFFYRVTAVDSAGNESAPSETLTAMAIPPGPTVVRGAITGETRWYRAASPYILAEEAVVDPAAVLTIDPGVRVLSRGGALKVRGRLVARGTARAPIEFARDQEIQEKAWAGLEFDGAASEKSELAYCRISGAATGIRVSGAAVETQECVLAGNALGIEVAGETSHLTWQGGRLEANRNEGLVVRGGTVRLDGVEVSQNSGAGVQISGGTVEVSNSTFGRNGAAGLVREGGSLVLRRNRFELTGGKQVINLSTEHLLDARDNYWGATDPEAILTAVSSWVDVSRILDGPGPEAKTIELPILRPPLSETLRAVGILVPWFGPYVIPDQFEVGEGGVLRITPGVTISFGSKAQGIVVRGGAIVAEGTRELPIRFLPGSAASSPGAYGTAIRIERSGPIPNRLSWAEIRHATTGLRMEAGRTEISFGEVADNRLNGIEVSGRAAVTITGVRILRNPNGAGVVVTGDAKPILRRNTIAENGWAILNQTPYTLDARENWWGSGAPNEELFVGLVDRSNWVNDDPFPK